jgi:sugar-specific transcriptional regulator TrmB
MTPHHEINEILSLQSLGLTQSQARVYLALVKSENAATAKTLSNASGLATCDVYRVLMELHNLGLSEVVVASPKEFRATSPSDAMEIMLGRREKETEEIFTKAQEFLKKIHTAKKCELEEATKMALIPAGIKATQFGMPKIKATKKDLNAIQTNTLFHRFVHNTFEELLKLLARGVKVRFVVDSLRGIEKAENEVAVLVHHPNCEIRVFDKIEACLLIHDNTDSFFSTSTDTVNTPSFWSSNSCVVAITRIYFETIWDQSTKFNECLLEKQLTT